MSLLTARKLVKSYRKRRVVDEVSFRVEAGEIVGLLGPNGAGKTTSFLMVLGMVRPVKDLRGKLRLDERQISV